MFLQNYVGWLGGLFCFTANQPFPSHLTPNESWTVQVNISIVFVYKQLNVKSVQLYIKTVLFQTIHFNLSAQFRSI